MWWLKDSFLCAAGVHLAFAIFRQPSIKMKSIRKNSKNKWEKTHTHTDEY